MHLFGFSKKTKKTTFFKEFGSWTTKVDADDTSSDSSSSNSSNNNNNNNNNDGNNIDKAHQILRKSLDSAMNEKASQELLEASKSEIAPPLSPSKHVKPPTVTIDQPSETKEEKAKTSIMNNNQTSFDLNTLLSLETQQRLDAQTERDKSTDTPPRPTRLKFALPETPTRSRSPNNQHITYPRARPYRSLSAEGDRRQDESGGRTKSGRRRRRHRRWSLLMGSDTDDDDEKEERERAMKRHLEIGTYVRLIKRPLPTYGHVKYIGPVGNEPGDWIGVELEHRVGNCDGSIKGQHYFKTDPQRGIFLKRFDVEAVI
ncbi:uncharacterized protein BX664DRAFT_389394 [Halteromyces radiatus]|uniref:uncharacterized protein n=1 Tax=Halteromyces radiatus TaxID=101107 RepID=UPI00221F0127|nr:uncharacterized protein BX664DRAFT_389394 [Halteromyces radiatus]KAI8077801.1 hypothetical protein BX664DRAFT_389394 [Halteromyces radiatus]